jgi:hypothetical protein
VTRDFRRKGVAIVIETGDLVQTLCDFLLSFGYQPISAPNHALAAERALAHDKVSLLVAAVPAPDESLAGIYLEDAAKRHQSIAVVLMLSDPLEQSPGAPERAVKIVKPFGKETFIEAIELSEIRASSI